MSRLLRLLKLLPSVEFGLGLFEVSLSDLVVRLVLDGVPVSVDSAVVVLEEVQRLAEACVGLAKGGRESNGPSGVRGGGLVALETEKSGSAVRQKHVRARADGAELKRRRVRVVRACVLLSRRE
jgi:hypothetical protein